MDLSLSNLISAASASAGDKEILDVAQRLSETALRKLHKNTLAFEPVLLKSSLFGASSGMKNRAIYDSYTALSAYGRTRIEYKGEELRQDDLRLLLVLLKARAGGQVGNATSFVPRAFCRDVLGWADSSESVVKLKACILRLQDARARVYFDKGMLALSFISDAQLLEGCWTVWLSDLLAPLLAGNNTFMNADERLTLLDGMETWLYGFIKADSCMLGFDLAQMRDAAGSNAPQKEFNRKLTNTLKAFVDEGLVAGFAVSKGKLMVKKN